MRAEVSPSASRRTDDNGCPEDAEEGNVVSMRVFKRMHSSSARGDSSRLAEDASFARSFDPCTLILTMHASTKVETWWGGRNGITVGQARVTGRNQHWG
jgi:hypothetical protein